MSASRKTVCKDFPRSGQFFCLFVFFSRQIERFRSVLLSLARGLKSYENNSGDTTANGKSNYLFCLYNYLESYSNRYLSKTNINLRIFPYVWKKRKLLELCSSRRHLLLHWGNYDQRCRNEPIWLSINQFFNCF